MDADHDLICEVFPWLTEVMEEQVRDNYFDMLCDDPSGKTVFNEFWECVPKHVWPNPSEVKYMWEDYLLLTYEPWVF